MFSLLFQAAQVPQKKKSSDSLDESTCSNVRPTLMFYLALAQTENDPWCTSDLGSDLLCLQYCGALSLLQASFGGCAIKPMYQHTVLIHVKIKAAKIQGKNFELNKSRMSMCD